MARIQNQGGRGKRKAVLRWCRGVPHRFASRLSPVACCAFIRPSVPLRTRLEVLS